MRFSHIVKKNFVYHFKQYLAFFLCISFSIMVFYMYAILFYNSTLSEAIRYTTIEKMMQFVFYIITIFSFFFVNYAYHAFINAKYKEIGLFITLGITHKEIKKMIRLEYLVLMCLSMITAIITGLVFSKLFFMIFLSILEFKDIPFMLNYKSFLITIIVFLLIFLFVFIRSNFTINRLKVTELLKKEVMKDTIKYHTPYLGFLGFFLTVISYFIMYQFLMKNYVHNLMFYIMLCFVATLVGVYLMISQFGYLLIHLVKKKVYHQKILFFSELKHHFRQYTRILYLSTLLIGVAIYFIGLTFSVYLTQFDEIKKAYPYDLMLVNTAYSTPLSENEIDAIFKKHDIEIKEENTLEFLQLVLYKTTSGKYGIWGSTVVISEDMYYQIANKNIDVKKNYAIPISFEDGAIKWFEKKEDLVFKDLETEKTYNFQFQEEKVGQYFNMNNYELPFLVVLDNENYKALESELGMEKVNTIQLFKFDNWLQSKPLVLDFVEAVKKKNREYTEDKVFNQLYNVWDLMPSSRVLAYEHNMRSASFNFFVMSSIGIIFAISIGVVLYLKLFSDLPHQKKRVLKIRRIGLSNAEIIKSLVSELKVIFFIPLTLGLLLGFLYILITAINFIFYEKVILYCLLMMGIFIIIYSLFYLITKKQYIKQIIE